MTRVCTICSHGQRHQINVALVQREPYRHIASHYSVSTGALQRHSREHLPKLLVEASRAVEAARADELLRQVRALQSKTLGILLSAEASGELRTALSAIREARSNVELLAKLQGELAQEGTVNIYLNQEYIEARTLIVQALEPYPDARDAVVGALEHGGNGSG